MAGLQLSDLKLTKFNIDEFGNVEYGNNNYIKKEKIEITKLTIFDINNNYIKKANIYFSESVMVFTAIGAGLRVLNCVLHKPIKHFLIVNNNIKKLKLNIAPEMVWCDFSLKNKKTFDRGKFYGLK